MKWFAMLSLVVCLTTPVEADSVPDGWISAGSHPKDYKVSMDSDVAYSGSVSALLESRSEGARGFGTLMQQCEPGPYSGKRVRMTGYVRSRDVRGWAGLWLRVDGEGRSLAFDNMRDRPIKGSSKWKQYNIVLDVPEGAKALAYGVLLSGAGKVWVDDIKIEIADKSAEVTSRSYELPSAPTNLDFEN